MDTDPLSTAYESAANLANIYSLLVIKNGYLIAEAYYNGATVSQHNGVASVTKSISSALTGIALREDVLTSVDQKMRDFFPEFDFERLDPRKSDITIRHILEMRTGYPWEEMDGYLDEYTSTTNFLPFIEEFPLLHDPGTEFGYSLTMAHVMGVILARASRTSLRSFGETHLFGPLGITVGEWLTDSLGYYYAGGTIHLTPRDMARFGQLFLDGGAYDGSQIIPAEWVEESTRTYSMRTYETEILSSAQPQTGFGPVVWQAEKAVMEVVGRLIGSL